MSPKKSIETEQSILNAARSIFFTKGLQGARMQEIADEAGINKALLHYYFRSKDQLFEKVFYEAIGQFFPGLRSILTSGKPVTETVEEFVHFYISMLIENPFLPGFIFHEMSTNKERLAGFLTHKGNPIQLFLKHMQSEMDAGRIRQFDPRQFFVSMMSMCIFPFIGKPMLSIALELDETSFLALMEERKQFVIQQLKGTLTP